VFCDEGPTLAPAGERRIVARPDGNRATTEQLVGLLPSLPRCELILLTSETTRPAAAGALSRAVSQHPVGGRVQLLDVTARDSSASRLAALLRSADLAIVTGDEEPDIDLALRAMACGAPLVAQEVGAVADIVADGVTGLLVPPTSWEGLGDAARGLLGDEMRRESFGFAAGDRVRASFDWAAIGPGLARVLDEVVAGEPVAAGGAP
jgi:D-inositol-3-phosphate glycosyltransferase